MPMPIGFARNRLGLLALAAGVAALPFMAPVALAEAVAPQNVTASSIYVSNADTGDVLYRKGDDKPVRLHSLTKLMTAYVAIQRVGHALSEDVTIQSRNLTTGASAGLRKGDAWALQDLLYGMLLVSGNDAALAIAEHTGRALLADEGKRGDPTKRFVKEMNAAAKSLGAKTARFADPTGLSPSNTGTTQDVALIGGAVFREPTLQPFWRCARRSFTIGGPEPRTITLDSTIEILGEDRIIGAKTGSHLGNNIYNLAVAWRAPNGQTIVAVVLRSASNTARYDDMRAILAALPRDLPALAEQAAETASISGEDCPEPQHKPSPSGG
jgi:D-alanyl-D-alanine carboxypeptidase